MTANDRPYRVVLLGGKALAVDCLDSLLRMPEVEVVGVVPCADDDPAIEQWYPSLARRARALSLSVCQPRSANEADFLPVLEQLRPHVMVSIFYDKILKPRVLNVPTVAATNVHFGLLPYNRGSMPIPWAIIDGNDPGVTMHYMDPGVDTGDVIAQIAVPAAEHETSREVYDRCTAAGRYLFERHLPLLLRGKATRRRQPAAAGSYYKPGYPHDRWIDWSQSTEAIGRLVRALTFPPFPSARTSAGDAELEVCHPVWASTCVNSPGMVTELTPNWATIATGDASLSIRTMRLNGTEMSATQALREAGYSIGSRLESKPWMQTEAA